VGLYGIIRDESTCTPTLSLFNTHFSVSGQKNQVFKPCIYMHIYIYMCVCVCVYIYIYICVYKAMPVRAYSRHWGFQEFQAPTFRDSRHMTVVRFSALLTGCLYLPMNIIGTTFCYRLSRTQGRSAAGRIMSMKNFNETTGNRRRDFSACSTVPAPTAVVIH